MSWTHINVDNDIDNYPYNTREIIDTLMRSCSTVDHNLSLILDAKERQQMEKELMTGINEIMLPVFDTLKKYHQDYNNKLADYLLTQYTDLTEKFRKALLKYEPDGKVRDLLFPSLIPSEYIDKITVRLTCKDNMISLDDKWKRYDPEYGYYLKIHIYYSEMKVLDFVLNGEYDETCQTRPSTDLSCHTGSYFDVEKITNESFYAKVYYVHPKILEIQKETGDFPSNWKLNKNNDEMIQFLQWMVKTITEIEPKVLYKKGFKESIDDMSGVQIQAYTF